MRLKVLSWNLDGRVRVREQIELVGQEVPDIVAFQEVVAARLGEIKERLTDIGLSSSLCTIDLWPSAETSKARQLGVLVASRWPLALPERQFQVPFAEKALSVEVATPDGPVRVHNVHVPNGSSHKWKKIETFETIREALKADPGGHQILCGDFNSPQMEFPSGEVATFGQRIVDEEEIVSERKRDGDPPDRWALGERSVIVEHEEFGFVDAFRLLHGYETDGYSWENKRGDRVSRRRFDHVFCSRSLRPVSCRYVHECRECRLSDHSAIEAVLDM